MFRFVDVHDSIGGVGRGHALSMLTILLGLVQGLGFGVVINFIQGLAQGLGWHSSNPPVRLSACPPVRSPSFTFKDTGPSVNSTVNDVDVSN